MQFAVWVSVLHSTLMQLLSACGGRERVDAIFDLVRVRVRIRWGGFMSNESVTECHGTSHVRCTISLWCTFSVPLSIEMIH